MIGLFLRYLLISVCIVLSHSNYIVAQDDLTDVYNSFDIDEEMYTSEAEKEYEIEDPDLEIDAESIKASEESVGAETFQFSEEVIGVQGNWVKKRKWLEQSLELNDTVHSLVNSIKQASSFFSSLYASIDEQIDQFYQEISFQRGKLETVFDDVELYLKKKKEKKLKALKKIDEDKDIPSGYREFKTEEIEEEIRDFRSYLTQLQFDINSIEDLDKSLNARLQKIDEQISIASTEAERAHQISDKMWFVIDDRKAKEQYYSLLALEKQEQSRFDYINSVLKKDFNEVIDRIHNQMSKVQQVIQELEEKGIILKKRNERIEKLQRKQRVKQEEKVDIVPKKPRHRNVSALPWYQTILRPIAMMFKGIVDWFVGLSRMLFEQQQKTSDDFNVEYNRADQIDIKKDNVEKSDDDKEENFDQENKDI